ncbi:HesA/MoeB/ThiF family protein [Ferrimonas aestuarii]|nr:HesA/MoeB/ThiF family protein [Ferrimonas aestuarii]
MLDDNDYLRYGRQLLLPDWGEGGQQAIANAKVLVIGLGGLGVSVLASLAGCGVGKLVLVDGDKVSLSNLHRQWIYQPEQVGMAKVHAATRWANQLNPDVHVDAYEQMVDELTLHTLLPEVDLVLDCTDNLGSRHLINRGCCEYRRPLISGAAIGWQGQLQYIAPSGPCFACLCPQQQGGEPANCREAGVVPPVVSAIGHLQALMALKVLLNQPLDFHLRRFDGHTLSWQQFELGANPDCTVCGGNHESHH